MEKLTDASYLALLHNQIDITQVPFSDRGSRLLVYQVPGQSRLLIKLAERIEGGEPGLGGASFIRDLRLVDETGETLAFEVETYPDVILFHTRSGVFRLAFQDQCTLCFGLPAYAQAGLRFRLALESWLDTGRGGEVKAIRHLTYTTNGKVIQNSLSSDVDGAEITFIVRSGDDSSLALHINARGNPWYEVLPFSHTAALAQERWSKWFKKVPPVAEPYRSKYAYAWWVMANNLVSPLGKVAYEAMMPSKVSYIGLWLWDSAMHALAYRHVDPELARNQIRAFLACQLPDGMLPDAIYDEGVVSEIDHPIPGRVTKPPILAWAALKLHETAPDLDFLREIYAPLVRWNEWWFRMNDDDADGLAQYNHPYSSGLDDNPLWDYGMPVESPDLNTYLYLQMRSFATIAGLLGKTAEGEEWRRRAAAIVRRMVEDFWDEETGIFRALHDEQPVPVITPFNLYPLWTGELPGQIQERLIAHLCNPEMFWGEHILPTVARNDPHYSSSTMWRGPVWANINYFFIEALQQIHEHELARQLRNKTLELLMRHPGICEYYDSQTGFPPPRAAGAFGWTAAVFIELALQASADEIPSGGCPPG